MKYKKILFASMLILGVYTTLYTQEVNSGNPYMGQIYYKYTFAPKLGYNGAVFAKKFTKAQWQELFYNGGEKFFKEFKLSNKGIDSDVLYHLEAFALYYAKDSDIKPTCQN
jgi:hypothetical protein